MPADNATLADRAHARSETPWDYWDRAFHFLLKLGTRTHLSKAEWNWRSQLRQELREPWE